MPAMLSNLKKKLSTSGSGSGDKIFSGLSAKPAPIPAGLTISAPSPPPDHRDDDPSICTSVNANAPSAPSHAASPVGLPPPAPTPRYQDQPETDYDLGPTQLYTFIENKHWESAVERVRTTPLEAKTWISRREPENPNVIRWRLLPLHATCVFRAPLSLIEALIRAHPEGPAAADDQGMLPLHLACRNGASRGVVVTLLNAHPESIDARDKKGRTPLNLVENSNSQNKDVVIEAMQQFRISMGNERLPPAGAGVRAVSPAVLAPSAGPGEREVDYENRTILFRLILKKDWDGVSGRLGAFPDEASTWIVTKGYTGDLRFLPLHKACVLNPPPQIIDALVKAFPEGVARADQDGWLPLHCACFYNAPASSIDILIRADPKATTKKDDDGRLPLHYACLKGAPESVVGALLAANIKGALVKDNDGRMPLHHACSKAASDGVVETLVRLGPKAAQSKDNNGRLPLHLACKKGITKNALTILLQVYARGAAAKDDQEKLPVHHACQTGACSPAAVLALLDAHPESIHARTAFGLTPHDEARQPKQGVNADPIVEVLDRFKAEQERLGGASGAMDSARVRELENRVVELANRVDLLSGALNEVVHVAAQLKADLINNKRSDGKMELKRFCDNLMSLNLGGSGVSLS